MSDAQTQMNNPPKNKTQMTNAPEKKSDKPIRMKALEDIRYTDPESKLSVEVLAGAIHDFPRSIAEYLIKPAQAPYPFQGEVMNAKLGSKMRVTRDFIE